MYLKSLVLKGFKSFADRSALALEPGITAIVGPNGSGKSNISDAVLWVLGERSARNLRGQAMEDIIFSGSAARKAVSVAEVDLVLDNTDNTIPVDYDEVVITRRMYRSGESEYLVNGVVARRLDVLDILHDSGLGTGTHSIISQGSLDSILQSRPEDRRALIEEAAGVLKHKQRKEKSARKLAQMDVHLARVGDIVAEITHQMGPLERKAKRAKAYKVASGELADLRLALAVDDLRALQKEWDAICAAEQALSGEVEAKRQTVADAEQKVNDFQELMKRESEDAGVLARRQRRAASLSERLDSADILLRERKRQAVSSQADLRASVESSAYRRREAARELEGAREQLAEVEEASQAADAKVAELSASRAELDARHKAAEERITDMAVALRKCDDETEAAKRRQATLAERLSSGMARSKLAEARHAELASAVEQAQGEYDGGKKARDEAAAAAADLKEREGAAKAKLLERFEKRDAAHAARDAAREDVRLVESEIKAIEKAQQARRKDEPALRWVMEHAERFEGGVISVAKTFKVPRDLESLVERLVADDVESLAVRDAQAARQVADALRTGTLAGDVSLVMQADEGSVRAHAAAAGAPGRALIDEIAFEEDMRPVVEALLGDVVVCDTYAQAFEAHGRDAGRARYVSRDGVVIWPSGKVRIFGATDKPVEGVIAQERRLSELRDQLKRACGARDEAEAAAIAADEAYREMQATSLDLSQKLANAEGVLASAETELTRAERKLADVKRDIDEAARQAEEAKRNLDGIKPDMQQAEQLVAELVEKRAALVAERDAAAETVDPLRREVSALAEKLTEAKLAAATLSERRTYVERIVVARKRDIEGIDASARKRRRSIAVKGVVIERSESAIALLGEIAATLSRRLRLLDEALQASESTANSVHASAAAARDDARRAHDEYDETSARMAQVRVDKGKVEMRVEAAVNVIVGDLGVPIDHAQQLPALEDRKTVEDEVFRLQRKIKNMGAINPDAADEYAKVKERYDYLAGQLADMQAARRSLNRIVRVIDERMKDDFVRTYEEVNGNFNEIFSLLFPGGTAHLSLEDPDDLEHTGVEVTAQPRGKRLTKMMLMSGGEKSLTALALLFAVYKTRATPFYILDEVEAALDDTNLRRLIAYIDSLRSTTQLIMITHQRRTMEMADVLFGVSMQADGVTKVISQKLERALELSE